MGTVATVGVYGFDAGTYLEALRGADVDVVLDVRQRRGVRGPEYAWANSLRLQAALAGAGVEYRHLAQLAPTTELRHVQYREDARVGVGKRSRAVLAPEYSLRYTREILDGVNLRAIFVPLEGRRPALMCVERHAAACHRSLIAARVREELGWRIEDLAPTAR